ncbi:hypothetical protein ACLI4Q_03900 [Natrialbaceae archaeon A-CW1-1]
MDEKWEELFDRVFDEIFEPSDMAVQRKTLKKRAVAARPVLVELAEEGDPGDEGLVTKKRNTTEYGKLADEVGSDATYMAKVLGAIDHVGQQLGDPPLSPLVESADTVGPGRGYFNWAYLGDDRIRKPGKESSLTPEMKAKWRRHLRSTYEHDSWYQYTETPESSKRN